MINEGKPKVIVVIPARGGSKGIYKKNLSLVAGEPLIGRSIRAARKTQLVDDVVVSTDNKEILNTALKYGAYVVERPAEISGDTASSESALLHAAEKYIADGNKLDIIVLLQCTSPFTTPSDIDGTIRPVLENKADSCFAASIFHHFIWKIDKNGKIRGINHDGGHRERRQDLDPQYIEAGSVYAMNIVKFKEEGYRFCGKTHMYEVNPRHVFEIDTQAELRQAQLIAYELDMPNYTAQIPYPIHAMVFDFDGVFTDNAVYINENGKEAVRCNRSDGMAIEMLRAFKIPMIVLSKERNLVVESRCKKLKLPVLQGLDNKIEALKNWLKKNGYNPNNTIFLGNDINDKDCLKYVGCGVGPIDSHKDIVDVLNIRLPIKGGYGLLRFLADIILSNNK